MNQRIIPVPLKFLCLIVHKLQIFHWYVAEVLHNTYSRLFGDSWFLRLVCTYNTVQFSAVHLSGSPAVPKTGIIRISSPPHSISTYFQQNNYVCVCINIYIYIYIVQNSFFPWLLQYFVCVV